MVLSETDAKLLIIVPMCMAMKDGWSHANAKPYRTTICTVQLLD